jgi:CheY-like chemotaxis protein
MSAVPRRRADRQDRPAEPLPASAVPIEEDSAKACNALEALELLRHNSVDVRLILSDVRMPGTMDGVASARTVRCEFPVTKIVLTSGNLTDLDWIEHDGFFPKPYNSEQIIKHINRLLD